MQVPEIGGPGLKRNDLVRYFKRWTSRHMVYQLLTQAPPMITATTALQGARGTLVPAEASPAGGEADRLLPRQIRVQLGQGPTRMSAAGSAST